jgi:hypothetical protein
MVALVVVGVPDEMLETDMGVFSTVTLSLEVA